MAIQLLYSFACTRTCRSLRLLRGVSGLAPALLPPALRDEVEGKLTIATARSLCEVPDGQGRRDAGLQNETRHGCFQPHDVACVVAAFTSMCRLMPVFPKLQLRAAMPRSCWCEDLQQAYQV